MYLHLLRHAHAGDWSTWIGDDDARPLTDKGRGQAERLGRFLARQGFAPDRILTSPKVRAAETAGIVGRLLDVSVDIDDRLGGPLDLSVVERILDDHGDPETPVLVGHDPDLSELVVIELNANPAVETLEDVGRWDLIETIWRANFDAAIFGSSV